MQTAKHDAVETAHPLDPLTADEIQAAVAILRRDRGLTSDHRFVYVTLKEAPKADVLAFAAGSTIERVAALVLRDRKQRKTIEAEVSITRDKVVAWREVPHVQPAIMQEEVDAAEAAVRNDPRWREAMSKRGVTDLDLAIIDPWPVGYNGPADAPEKGRFAQPLTWVRTGPEDHAYARPVEGLIVRFDVDEMKVVEVEDHGVVPLPPRKANYTVESLSDPTNFPHFPAGPRRDVKPLDIMQSEGASFQVEGHLVRWQKWSFRVGFTPREGLVLHNIGYEDQGRVRPVLYRASVSEMFVPYGDPSPTHRRKNVFDMGEYGVGMLCNSLELGCDCLGEIHYFDGVVNENNGDAKTIVNAICLHEEDYGVLWKHTDFRTGKAEVRRSRRLAVSTIATIGNYEYGYFWYLYQDGTIAFEIKMTGVISNGAVPQGTKPRFGELVAPGVYGPNHQHLFSIRLDVMVDGPDNTVYECDSIALPDGPDNPHGNAWEVRATPLVSEAGAQRLAQASSARYWKIVNPNRKNALGQPVAYRLMPGETPLPLYQPHAYAIKRAGFATRHLWVTAYSPDELFAAGEYPNQHPGGAGLPAYTRNDRPLENTDVVVWYTLGAHHVVRPEEWPVMPVNYVGFHLKLDGFFDGNPALDVPPSHGAEHDHHHNGA